MKAQAISNRIRNKMDSYLNSIEDEALRKRVKSSIVVTGGCITSMFLKEKINDYDLYLTDVNVVLDLTLYYITKFIKNNNHEVVPLIRITYDGVPEDGQVEGMHHRQVYRIPTLMDEYGTDAVYGNYPFINEKEKYRKNMKRVEVFIKSKGFESEEQVPQVDEEYEYFESNKDPSAVARYLDERVASENQPEETEYKPPYRPVFMSSNAITLSDKVQIVIRFWGTTEQIHQTYDFVHATNYWTYAEGLVTNKQALECILAKDLVYTGSEYPFASIFRTRKFVERGWYCHVGNYVKMGMQLGEYDLTDVSVLEEQLTGVDAAYLHQIIAAVKRRKNDNKEFEFNSAYICELVDRMMQVRKD